MLEARKRMAATHGKLPLDEARSQLRAAGLRCTPARIRVLQHLAASAKPLSHAAVADAAGCVEEAGRSVRGLWKRQTRTEVRKRRPTVRLVAVHRVSFARRTPAPADNPARR